MLASLRRTAIIALGGVLLPLIGCRTGDPGVDTTFLHPMSEASSRQAADDRPTQQMMLDLKSIGLEPGSVVRYGGGASTSPTYAVEYGGPYSMWRVEEFAPPAGIDLAELEYQIEALHRDSAKLIEAELKLRLAEHALQGTRGFVCPKCGQAYCDGTCDQRPRGRDDRARWENDAGREVRVSSEMVERRRHDVEQRERVVRDMLRQPNVLVFRWESPDGSSGGYAVAAGLRRVRLVLGNDFARLRAYGSIDETGAIHDSDATGVVTAALQARQVIYVEQDDLRDTMTRVLSAMGPAVQKMLSDRDVIELEMAIAFENERLNSFQHRGFYSRPKRFTLPVNWEEFLAGRMPPQLAGGMYQAGSTESEWVTFVAATTQLRTLDEAGRLGPRGE